jgi:hypothetical protein
MDKTYNGFLQEIVEPFVCAAEAEEFLRSGGIDPEEVLRRAEEFVKELEGKMEKGESIKEKRKDGIME